MTDIVERLRKLADRERPYGSLPDTLEEAAAEIERLRAKCNMQAMILQRLRPEHNPGVYFICGQLGPLDRNGLPEKVMIVPAYGCDWSQIYVKSERQTGPEW